MCVCLSVMALSMIPASLEVYSYLFLPLHYTIEKGYGEY